MEYQDCENCRGKAVRLAHIGVYVTDLPAMEAFLKDKLGFVERGRSQRGETELVFLDLGNCPIELIYNPRNEKRTGGMIEHICLEVEDIDSLVCQLDKKGVKFLQEKVGDMPDLLGGVKNIFLEGPEGLKLEFFEYYKK